MSPAAKSPLISFNSASNFSSAGSAPGSTPKSCSDSFAVSTAASGAGACFCVRLCGCFGAGAVKTLTPINTAIIITATAARAAIVLFIAVGRLDCIDSCSSAKASLRIRSSVSALVVWRNFLTDSSILSPGFILPALHLKLTAVYQVHICTCPEPY